jgi:diguanylate cyclase (GGDEF)-like protein
MWANFLTGVGGVPEGPVPEALRMGRSPMEKLAALWQRPAPQLIAIGREGEVLAARVRVWVAVTAALVPLANLVLQPWDVEPWVGLGSASVILIASTVTRSLAARPSPPPLLGAFSCVFDISVVSAANLAFILGGQPLAATSGRVFFSAYFLALGLSCLRQDARFSLIAGLTAIFQYAAIVLAAVTFGDVTGAVPAGSSYGSFRWDNQIARLALLALATAINIAIVRQAERHMTASLHDPLTGLPNRRYAEDRLEQAIAIAARNGKSVVVALFDLDFFKLVNDRFGHPAGDHVLRQTAERMRRYFRLGDVAARFGGEEFLILFPESDVAGAMDRLRRFHTDFSARRMHLPGSQDTLRVTSSVGVATYPADGESAAAVLEQADRRLYAVKHSGRNRVQGPES